MSAPRHHIDLRPPHPLGREATMVLFVSARIGRPSLRPLRAAAVSFLLAGGLALGYWYGFLAR